MSAPVTRGAFAHKMAHVVTLSAWRVPDGSDRSLPLDIPPCATVPEAMNAALATCRLAHKDALLIRYEDTGRGRSFLHTYAIKRKSQARYVRGPDMTSRAVHDLYPVELFAVAVDAFAPTRPFDALRDDARGVDLSLVES